MNFLNRKIRAAGGGPERKPLLTSSPDRPGTGDVNFPSSQGASPVSLTLPMPPSVNECFRNVPGKGRVKTEVYLDWLGHAGWTLRDQKPGRVSGYVVMVVSIERGSASADIDNRIKALFDLLVKHEIIDDDKFVVGFVAAWAPAASKLARVMIMPAHDCSFDFKLAHDGATGGFFLSAPPPEQGFPQS